MTRFSRFFWMLGVILIVLSGICVTLRSEAQTSNATISGSVIDVTNQLPISNARVDLLQGESTLATTTTASDGTFQFANQPPGIYTLEVSANGFVGTRSETIAAAGGTTARITTTLVRTRGSGQQELRQIGRITAAGAGAALQTSSTITQQLSTDLVQREATLRLGDALQTLPGVTSFNLDAAPGDDLNISIRGFKPSESQTLIDGHPVGPIGASSGTGLGYNYQLSPSFGLGNVQVAYGTGGEALYGGEMLSGAIDFQTINPTRRPEFSVRQGAGNYGRRVTDLTGTGTFGKLGVAAVYGVEGTWGGFSPQTYTQNALLVAGAGSNPQADVTTANIAANTWSVSGNYLQRQNLLKLRYDFSPATSMTLTGYDATSWADKTGEGDNDYWSSEYTGYFFDQNAGAVAGCAGVIVATNSGNACYNRQQFVNSFTGPFGGSPIAWQALRNQDYSLDFHTQAGIHTIRVNPFYDIFTQIYDRNNAGFLPQYRTYGGTVSDTIAMKNNALAVGYQSLHQAYIFRNYGPTGDIPQPVLFSSWGNYFVRDNFTPPGPLSYFLSGWVKQSSVTKATYFDPRASIVFRATPNDVIRFSAGEAHEDPNISLLSQPLTYNLTPTNISPSGSGLTPIASGSNRGLHASRVQDIEISVGHRFYGDTQVQVVGYNSVQKDPIFPAIVPLSSLGVTPAGIPNPPGLGAYLARIGGTFANLGATTVFNAGWGHYQGIDITGRVRPTRNFFVDFGYDLSSARLYDMPLLALQNNAVLISGVQINKVPFQKAQLGLDYSTRGGFQARLDNFFVGQNNAILRPPYFFANGSISQRYHGVTFNLGIQNVFNGATDQFGRFGLSTFQPENSLNSDPNALGQAYAGLPGSAGERFGIPPRTFLFSLTFRSGG